MRPALLLACLALLASPAGAEERIRLTPEQIGEAFCLSRLGGDIGPIVGLLSPGLSAAIAEAETRNATWAAAHPGDKPPLGDGIPWQTAPDYAAGCSVGPTSARINEATVAISYSFPEAPEAGFTDRLLLTLLPVGEDGSMAWRIDDIAYADEGRLRAALVAAFLD